MSPKIIEITDLTKKFNNTCALNNISFSLNKGEILGVLGPNGAGKTTAIHIILGLLTPTSGNIRVLGLQPIQDQHVLAPKINFASAYTQLPSNLTVIENLKFYSRIYNVPNMNQQIARILELLEISHLQKRLTGALSSGEKTRVNLAKSLLNDPELLVLDEPTASLDPDISDKIRTVLKRLKDEKQVSILYTSHNMYEVETICDRIIFLHKGQIMAQGSADDILRTFSTNSLEQTFIKIVRSGNLVSGEEE